MHGMVRQGQGNTRLAFNATPGHIFKPWVVAQRLSTQTHGIAPCTVYLAHHTPNHETHRLAHTKVRRRQLQKNCPHFMSMPNSLGSLSPLFSATPTMSRRSLVIDYKNEPRRAPQVTQG